MSNVTITDTIKNCPGHLQPALDEARARWARHSESLRGPADFRACQAGEVLEYAGMQMQSRSWAEPQFLLAAELGLWLLNTAHAEDVAARAARNAAAAPPQISISDLTAAELAVIEAMRAKR